MSSQGGGRGGKDGPWQSGAGSCRSGRVVVRFVAATVGRRYIRTGLRTLCAREGAAAGACSRILKTVVGPQLSGTCRCLSERGKRGKFSFASKTLRFAVEGKKKVEAHLLRLGKSRATVSQVFW